jgi:thiosulfate/3-mercaptopyruvate sulfurtransferase
VIEAFAILPDGWSGTAAIVVCSLEMVCGAALFLFFIPEMAEWDSSETAGKTQQDFETLLGPDKDRIIVIYCGFVKCTRSHNGALWARKLGYKNVFRFAGEIYAWKGEKFPVASED